MINIKKFYDFKEICSFPAKEQKIYWANLNYKYPILTIKDYARIYEMRGECCYYSIQHALRELGFIIYSTYRKQPIRIKTRFVLAEGPREIKETLEEINRFCKDFSIEVPKYYKERA